MAEGLVIVSEVLVSRLLARLDEIEKKALNEGHRDPDEGGFYACPATRSEPLGDLAWGEDACDCGLAERRESVLRLCRAPRDIIDMYVQAKAQPVAESVPHSKGRGLDHASAMGRLTALGLGLQSLARGLGVEDPEGKEN
jgi:hypothetical protein